MVPIYLRPLLALVVVIVTAGAGVPLERDVCEVEAAWLVLGRRIAKVYTDIPIKITNRTPAMIDSRFMVMNILLGWMPDHPG